MLKCNNVKVRQVKTEFLQGYILIYILPSESCRDTFIAGYAPAGLPLGRRWKRKKNLFNSLNKRQLYKEKFKTFWKKLKKNANIYIYMKYI